MYLVLWEYCSRLQARFLTIFFADSNLGMLVVWMIRNSGYDEIHDDEGQKV
jgi:hypothetical protein